jgi:hypothetical protein
MSKKYKAVRPGMSAEQLDALAQWQKDFQKAYPLIMQTQAVAQRLWQDLLDAPTHRVAVSDVPERLKEQVEQSEIWSVGHAQVNYVDHIDIKGDSE